MQEYAMLACHVFGCCGPKRVYKSEEGLKAFESRFCGERQKGGKKSRSL
jgi:hypothetical protein